MENDVQSLGGIEKESWSAKSEWTDIYFFTRSFSNKILENGANETLFDEIENNHC